MAAAVAAGTLAAAAAVMVAAVMAANKEGINKEDMEASQEDMVGVMVVSKEDMAVVVNNNHFH